MPATELKNKVIALAQNGRITCAQALKLANETGVSPLTVGAAADEAKIKITSCQLGCFK